MVQVLPYVPSFGEQITPVLNEALGNVAKGFGAMQMRKSDASIVGQLNNENLTDMQLQSLYQKLSSEGKKSFEPFLQSKLRSQEATHKEGLKRETEELGKAEKSEAVLSSSQKMRDLIKYTGSTMVPGPSFNAIPGGLNREGLQKRNQFNVLAASAASFFRDLDTKGQLPQGLYEQVIKPNLPNADLSERENLGRIEGLEDLAREYGGKTLREGKSKEKAPALTDDIAKQILAEAGGDPEKATKIAKKKGYEL